MWSRIRPFTKRNSAIRERKNTRSRASITPFEITDFSYDEETGAVEITFNSKPNTFYAMFGSTDLTNWSELDDGIESQGSSTTVTNSSTAPGTPMRYFQIREF